MQIIVTLNNVDGFILLAFLLGGGNLKIGNTNNDDGYKIFTWAHGTNNHDGFIIIAFFPIPFRAKI